MVEGHQCHRVAAAHRRILVGRSFIARSPNGRFKEGAAAINAKPLQRIEVHGKNLFYFFSHAPVSTVITPPPASPKTLAASPRPTSSSSPPSRQNGGRDDAASGGADGSGGSGGSDDGETVVMHVHFGMSGAFRTMNLPGPPPTETTRLELVNKEMGLVALLSAMTVAHGSLALYVAKAAQLGQDPLREDADKELLWSKLLRSRKPIGLVLMDQSLVAGVGNIYRAEILFKAGLHPELPACELTRDQYDKLWYHCVDLLQRGFVTGSILTVDSEEAQVLGRPWTRRYVYNQKTCGRCKGPVRTWDMATRTVYCCETCQPLRQQKPQQGEQQVSPQVAAAAGADDSSGQGGTAATALAPARLAAMAAARPPRLFRSHCAPDDPEDTEAAPAKLTVKELKLKLTAFNLDNRGTKPQLVERLEAALHWQQQQQQPNSDEKHTFEGVMTTATVVAPPSAALTAQLGRIRRRTEEVETAAEPVLSPEAAQITGAAGGAFISSTFAVLAQEVVIDGGAAKEAEVAGAGCQQGVSDEDEGSEEILDVAEKALTDSMAADVPGALPSAINELTRMTVVQLRRRLRDQGLPSSGTKALLLERLTTALHAAVATTAGVPVAGAATAAEEEPYTPPAADGAASAEDVAATTAVPPRPRKVTRPFAAGVKSPGAAVAASASAAAGASRPSRPSAVPLKGSFPASQPSEATVGVSGGKNPYDIQPGIRGLEARMASARDAVLEKLLSGENRAVEHVALEDDEVVDLLAEQPTPKARKRARSLAVSKATAAAAEAAEERKNVPETMGSSTDGISRRGKLIIGGSTAEAASELAGSHSDDFVPAQAPTMLRRSARRLCESKNSRVSFP